MEILHIALLLFVHSSILYVTGAIKKGVCLARHYEKPVGISAADWNGVSHYEPLRRLEEKCVKGCHRLQILHRLEEGVLIRMTVDITMHEPTVALQVVTGLRCQDCKSVDDVDAPKSACYDGTSSNMQNCGFMESCVAVKGEVDTVPKANPNATPVRKVAALRRCVSTLAAVAIHGCVTDANPYLHYVNDAQPEYIFSNFDGTICICQKDGCTEP